jgi:hypothetical protein
MPAAQQAGFLKRIVLGESPSVVIAELRRQLRSGARFAEVSVAARQPLPASAGERFAKARRIQADRERKARKRKVTLELQRLEAIARDEKTLWRRVDELIAGKATKAYDEAVSILKDLRALALHQQRREEFARQVEAIRGRHSRLVGLQWRIENAKLLEGLDSK